MADKSADAARFLAGIGGNFSTAANAFRGASASALDLIGEMRLNREERRKVREAELKDRTRVAQGQVLADRELTPEEIAGLDPTQVDVPAILAASDTLRKTDADITRSAAEAREAAARAAETESKNTPEAIAARRAAEARKAQYEEDLLQVRRDEAELRRQRLEHDRTIYQQEQARGEARTGASKAYSRRIGEVTADVDSRINSLDEQWQTANPNATEEERNRWKGVLRDRREVFIAQETAQMLPEWEREIIKQFETLTPEDLDNTFGGSRLSAANEATQTQLNEMAKLDAARRERAGQATGKNTYYMVGGPGRWRVGTEAEAERNQLSFETAQVLLRNTRGYDPDNKRDQQNLKAALEAVGYNRDAFLALLDDPNIVNDDGVTTVRDRLQWEPFLDIARERGDALRNTAAGLAQPGRDNLQADASLDEIEASFADRGADRAFLDDQRETPDTGIIAQDIAAMVQSDDSTEAKRGRQLLRERQTAAVEAFAEVAPQLRRQQPQLYTDIITALKVAGASSELEAMPEVSRPHIRASVGRQAQTVEGLARGIERAEDLLEQAAGLAARVREEARQRDLVESILKPE